MTGSFSPQRKEMARILQTKPELHVLPKIKMKTGIIVYSKTGNTLSVATKLMQKMITDGHTVQLEQITAIHDVPTGNTPIQLKDMPDIQTYDNLIFAAPVQAFSLCQVMNQYLTQLPSLQGKSISCFVTQQLPFPWLGGNHAIKQMKNICQSKGSTVRKTGIVNWSSKKKEDMISALLQEMIP